MKNEPWKHRCLAIKKMDPLKAAKVYILLDTETSPISDELMRRVDDEEAREKQIKQLQALVRQYDDALRLVANLYHAECLVQHSA